MTIEYSAGAAIWLGHRILRSSTPPVRTKPSRPRTNAAPPFKDSMKRASDRASSETLPPAPWPHRGLLEPPLRFGAVGLLVLERGVALEVERRGQVVHQREEGDHRDHRRDGTDQRAQAVERVPEGDRVDDVRRSA